MNTAILQMKKTVCEEMSKGRETSKLIGALKWKEGSTLEISSIRGQRDESGRRVTGKKALKAFARPETGPERNRLWGSKRIIGEDARISLLAYGLLRGRAYKTMEAKCQKGNEPRVYILLGVLGEVLPKGKVTEKMVVAWLDGGAAPQIFDVAA